MGLTKSLQNGLPLCTQGKPSSSAPTRHRSMNQTARLHDLQNTFELALAISRDNGDMQVLCVDFLPWADIAVSAHVSGWFGPSRDVGDARARWVHVSAHLWRCVSMERPRRMGMARVDFGWMEYWPTCLREEAHQDLGPFRAVIECRSPMERFVGPAR